MEYLNIICFCFLFQSIPDAIDCIDDDEIVNCPSSDCEEDEIAVATEDDLNNIGSGVESDHTHNSSSVCELPDCGDLEEEEEEGASSAIKVRYLFFFFLVQ